MKRINRLLSVASVVAALFPMMFVAGCSAALNSAASVNDGMYDEHNRVEIAERQRRVYAAREAENARRSEVENLLAAAGVDYDTYYDEPLSYSSVVADTYESAYMRRLKGFNSPSYRMPSSYYNFRYGSAFNYVSAYDPAFYNIMVSGNEVWVEPKYISSMFGTWGATNVTIGFGISYYPYNRYYGWNVPYYGSWWGYPRYSWYYDRWWPGYNPYYPWSYGFGWGPAWGFGWNYGWHHGPGPVWGAPHRPSAPPRPRPQRPNVTTRPAPTRYQSPSGRDNGSGGSRGTVNGSGVYRPGNSAQPSQPSRPSNSGTPTRNQGGSGSGSYNSNRGGSSSFFNGSSGSSTRNQGGSSSSGSSSGGSRSGGSTGRGNSIGR